MALNCRLCGKEIEALGCGRCRHCRQLVCGDCVAEESAQGVLCRVCAQKAGAAAPAEEFPQKAGNVLAELTAAGPARPAAARAERRSKLVLPLWAWMTICLLLMGAFALIALFPGARAAYLARQARLAPLGTARDAARALARMGGSKALAELTGLVERGSEERKLLALEALGDFAGTPAGHWLAAYADSGELGQTLRIAVQEAAIRQEQSRLAAPKPKR